MTELRTEQADPRSVFVETFSCLGEAARSAAASALRLVTALREADEQCERDAFWNHPGSVTS